MFLTSHLNSKNSTKKTIIINRKKLRVSVLIIKMLHISSD